jgi:hypothetical protein
MAWTLTHQGNYFDYTEGYIWLNLNPSGYEIEENDIILVGCFCTDDPVVGTPSGYTKLDHDIDEWGFNVSLFYKIVGSGDTGDQVFNASAPANNTKGAVVSIYRSDKGIPSIRATSDIIHTIGTKLSGTVDYEKTDLLWGFSAFYAADGELGHLTPSVVYSPYGFLVGARTYEYDGWGIMGVRTEEKTDADTAQFLLTNIYSTQHLWSDIVVLQEPPSKVGGFGAFGL